MTDTPLRRIVRNTAWGVLGLGLGAPLNLAVTIVLARGLGVEGLGVFKAVMAVVGVVQLTAEAGLSTVIVRRLVTEPEAAMRHLGQARALLRVFSIGAFLLVAAIAPLVLMAIGPTALAPWKLYVLVLIMTAGTLVTLHSMLHLSVFRAREEMGYNAAGFLIRWLLFFLFLVVVLFGMDGGVVWASVAFLGANAGLLAFYTLALRRLGGAPKPLYEPAAWASLVKESVPLGLGRALRRFTWQVDTILLAFLSTPASIGLYRAAYDPLLFLNWLPNVLAIPLFPHLSRLATVSPAEVSGAYRKAVKVLASLSLPAAVTVTVLAERLVLLAFGVEYAAAAPALQILIWSVVFLFFSSLYPFVFAALEANRWFAWVASIGLVAKVGLALALVPAIDFLGACWATLAAEIVLYLAGWFGLRRLGVRIPLLPGTLGPALLSAVWGALLWWVREQGWAVLLPVLIAGGVAYLAGLRLTGIFSAEEVRALREAVRRRRKGGIDGGLGQG